MRRNAYVAPAHLLASYPRTLIRLAAFGATIARLCNNAGWRPRQNRDKEIARYFRGRGKKKKNYGCNMLPGVITRRPIAHYWFFNRAPRLTSVDFPFAVSPVVFSKAPRLDWARFAIANQAVIAIYISKKYSRQSPFENRKVNRENESNRIITYKYIRVFFSFVNKIRYFITSFWLKIFANTIEKAIFALLRLVWLQLCF